MPKKIDLSERPGNLTYDLAQIMRNGQLKSATDPIALSQQLKSMADRHHGKGLSDHNYNEFVGIVDQLQNDLPELIRYVAYYVLVGSGNGSIDGRFRFGGNRYESIDAIANIISEGTSKVAISESDLTTLNEIYDTEFPHKFTVSVMPEAGTIVSRGFDDKFSAQMFLDECYEMSSNVAGVLYDNDGNNLETFI